MKAENQNGKLRKARNNKLESASLHRLSTSFATTNTVITISRRKVVGNFQAPGDGKAALSKMRRLLSSVW